MINKQSLYWIDAMFSSDIFGLATAGNQRHLAGICRTSVCLLWLLCAEKTCKNLAYLTLLNIIHKTKLGEHEKLVGECILGSILRDQSTKICRTYQRSSRITHIGSLPLTFESCHFVMSLTKSSLQILFEQAI